MISFNFQAICYCLFIFLNMVIFAVDGDIRLVDGPTTREGRVEVFHSGQWGGVCDDYFDINEAVVICRQLGLSGGSARLAAFYGQGFGPVWLGNLKCSGLENSLDSCGHMGWGNTGCSHAEDAGVICDGGKY